MLIKNKNDNLLKTDSSIISNIISNLMEKLIDQKDPTGIWVKKDTVFKKAYMYKLNEQSTNKYNKYILDETKLTDLKDMYNGLMKISQ